MEINALDDDFLAWRRFDNGRLYRMGQRSSQVVHQIGDGHLQVRAEITAIGANSGADAPAGMIDNIVEQDGAAFQAVGYVGNLEGRVNGFFDGDQIADGGGTFDETAEAHAFILLSSPIITKSRADGIKTPHVVNFNIIGDKKVSEYGQQMRCEMRDRMVVAWGLIVLLFTTLACNAFAGRPDSSLPPPPNPTIAPTAEAPVILPGLAPTATLPGDPTAATAQGFVRILIDLNIRSGPGVRFERVGFLLKDERAVVIGRDPESGWWKIQCPPDAEGSECWVSGGAQYTFPEDVDLSPATPAP
jgi:hypothetical protein